MAQAVKRDARRRIFFMSFTDFLLDQAVEAVSAVSVQGGVGNSRVISREEFIQLFEVSLASFLLSLSSLVPMTTKDGAISLSHS